MKQALKTICEEIAMLPAVEAKTFQDGRTVLIIVDMVNGFLTQGVMASPRCAGILPETEKLLRFAKKHRIPAIAFADCHEPDCMEFTAFPPHCIRGTEEAELAPSLREIGGFVRIEKNSTNGCLTQAFQEQLNAHPEWERFVVCGVCTDICVMQFALTLQCQCNQQNRKADVLVPVNAVETYDAPGHNGDLMQTMALRMMQQAGIRLTAEVRYNG